MIKKSKKRVWSGEEFALLFVLPIFIISGLVYAALGLHNNIQIVNTYETGRKVTATCYAARSKIYFFKYIDENNVRYYGKFDIPKDLRESSDWGVMDEKLTGTKAAVVIGEDGRMVLDIPQKINALSPVFVTITSILLILDGIGFVYFHVKNRKAWKLEQEELELENISI